MGDSVISVPVFNRNSAYARDILSKVSSEDIGQEIVPCVLKVQIENAFFKEQRLSSGLHRPYLEINGKVQEMFIEDSDDRMFMCGSKAITMNDPQDVRVSYLLSTNELVNLINRGLLYDDFEMPSELAGGTLEIPSEVVYTCVYDTPLTMVSVNKPWEIETSTKDNHYDTFFEMWNVSPKRAYEEHKNFVYSFDSFSPSLAAPPKSPITDYWDDDLPKEPRQEYIPDREVDTEEAFIKDFENVIKENEADIIKKRDQVAANAAKRKTGLLEIRKRHKDRVAEESRKAAADKDLYAQLMGDKNNDDDEGRSDKLRYDDIKSEVQTDYSAFMDAALNAVKTGDMSMLGGDGSTTKSEAEAKKSREAARLVDIAKDNQALNAGITDISGFGAADVTGNEAQMTAEEKREMQEKKSREAAQIVDRALDNQALNRGETDIAGQGAGHTMTQEEKAAIAGNALRNLLGRKPSAPAPDQPDMSGNGYI